MPPLLNGFSGLFRYCFLLTILCRLLMASGHAYAVDFRIISSIARPSSGTDSQTVHPDVTYIRTDQQFNIESGAHWQALTDTEFAGDLSRWQHFFISRFTQHNPSTDSQTFVIRQAGLQAVSMVTAFDTVKALALGYDSLQAESVAERSAFAVPMAPGQTITILTYCRVYPVSPREMPRLYHLIHWERSGQPLPGYQPASVTPYAAFVKSKRNNIWRNTLEDGISFGVLFTACLAALCLFFLTRDKAFVFYGLYVLSIGLYLWRDFEAVVFDYAYTFMLADWSQTRMMYLSMITLSYLWFIRYFLNTDMHATYISKGINVLSTALPLIVGGDAMLGSDTYLSCLLYQYLRILLAVLVLSGLIYLCYKKVPLARVILLGSLGLVIGDVITGLTAGLGSVVAFRLGVLAELSIFIFGLAYRTKLALDEKLNWEQRYNTQLQQEVREISSQLAKMERIRAIETTRTRIAQDIHDDLGADITKITYGAELASRLPGLETADYQSRFRKLAEQLQGFASHVREVLFAINPDCDPFHELQAYFREHTHTFWQGTEMALSFDFPESEENPIVSPEVKRHLLFLFKECMQNVAKHAEASHLYFCLRKEGEAHYYMEIRDNGRGFSLSALEPSVRSRRGIRGMHARAGEIGAKLQLCSQANEGTRICISGPLSGSSPG